MSLPGLANIDVAVPQQNATGGETVEIGARSEWRIEVPFTSTVTVRITEGIAEIFGTELANDVDYKFTGQSLAIYSHEGAKLVYTGSLPSEYTSEETQMSAYMNLHFALAKLRAERNKGPRVLIVGAKDSGKSTLAKILVSYANRMDSQPMLVNLNPAEGVFALPGSLSAAPISDILDVENGWGQSYTTGVTALNPKQPNVRYYGSDDIHTNVKFYKHNVSRLGVTVCARMEGDAAIQKSGCVVDTPPLAIKDVSIIEDIVSDFGIDVIVTVGAERLFVELRKRLGAKLTLLKVSKSDGCVDRDDVTRREQQQRAIKEYFYGPPGAPLNPYTAHVSFDVVKVFRPYLETADVMESSVMPIDEYGEEEEETKPKKIIEPVEPSSSTLLHCVVAFLQADKKEDEDEIVRSNVLGYAVVTAVDDTKSNLGILIPVHGRLPDNAMLLGSFRYIE